MTRTRTRTARTTPAGSVVDCWCPGRRAVLIATWRHEQLVSVVRQHYAAVCGLPLEVLDARQFERSASR